jgi:hypothetical protein
MATPEYGVLYNRKRETEGVVGKGGIGLVGVIVFMFDFLLSIYWPGEEKWLALRRHPYTVQ